MQETYSPHNLSLKFDLDRATALRVLKDVLPDAERTKGRPTYTIATFARALEAHRLKNASNANDGPIADGVSDTQSLTQARVRITLANAEAKEHANAIRRGEYTLNEVAAGAFGLVTSTIREVLLNLPGKLADKISALRDDDQSQSQHRGAVFGILRDEIYAALEILATPATYVAAGSAAAKTQPIQPVASPTEGATPTEAADNVERQ
jgi:hypothetical protein